MKKIFLESLQDGFQHITSISDPEQLNQLRREGVQVDTEGYYSFLFGSNKEFELRFEPIGEENTYLVALYKNNILLTEKVPVKGVE